MSDHFRGFIDIHNHILPGIDDGAANVEDSLLLISKFSEIGIKNFIATPHVMNDYYPNNPEIINEALDKVKQALEEQDMHDINISAAAEYMMDQSFLDMIDEQQLLCLKENYVLVEMSYFQPPINLNEILFRLQTQQYKPVLAHPERYVYFHSSNLDRYEELKRRGCYFQINALSLVGHYGTNIQKACFDLLDKDLVDFIGTDTHQLRHLEKLSSLDISEKRFNQLAPIVAKTIRTFKI